MTIIVLKQLQAHISGDCPLSGHGEGVCTPDTMVCALVRGSTRDNRRRWRGQKPLIFMRFHGVFLGSQHEIWPKQHNGKVSFFHTALVAIRIHPSLQAALLAFLLHCEACIIRLMATRGARRWAGDGSLWRRSVRRCCSNANTRLSCLNASS